MASAMMLQRRFDMRSARLSMMVVSGCSWLAFAVSANAAPVTVTGCLGKGDEEGVFELSHATGGDADDYELIPGKGVDLTPHLGHKVQITGEQASEPDERGRASEDEDEDDSALTHLKVSSLKHISAQCP
jgi:hypothetical protein